MATQSKKKAVILVVAIVVIALIGYLAYSKLTATSQGNKTAGGPATVKAMQVIKRDTPLNYEYAGNIKSTDEVKSLLVFQAQLLKNILQVANSYKQVNHFTKLTVVNMKVHCSQLKQH